MAAQHIHNADSRYCLLLDDCPSCLAFLIEGVPPACMESGGQAECPGSLLPAPSLRAVCVSGVLGTGAPDFGVCPLIKDSFIRQPAKVNS